VPTFSPKASDIQRSWHVVDAGGARLGRVATTVATRLHGKHKPIWAPHADCGDHVIVVNAAELDISDRKAEAKQYHRHSGYPGGLRSQSLARMMEQRPEQVVRLAVRRMLPKTRQGRAQLRRLRVYPGPDHPHTAQRPTELVVPRKGLVAGGRS